MAFLMMVYVNCCADYTRVLCVLFCSFPWNQKTLYGWMIETILNSTGFTSYIFYCFAFLTFFIGIVEYQRALPVQFKILYNKLNRLSQKQSCREIEKQLIRTVQFHVMMLKYGRCQLQFKT